MKIRISAGSANLTRNLDFHDVQNRNFLRLAYRR
jgi:hypothetical protein